MNKKEQHIFKQLKLAVTKTFLESYSASVDIEEWKGEVITAFQEDLFDKVKARVSEKWFYTYVKNDAKKLPRIDMLNLLSAYAGYKNWLYFSEQHNTERYPLLNKNKLRPIIVLLILLPLFFITLALIKKEHHYEFCFFDAIKNEPITAVKLNIKILQEKQSPIYMTTNHQGCFTYNTKADTITFIVQSPYYKTDTIVRTLKTYGSKMIKLKADDYALMLKFYTDGNIKDWKKHKQKLNTIIADDADIYQLYNNTNMVEIYSKDEFVQKLTIPTRNLKQMEILEKTEVNGQIVSLKFRIK